MIQWILIIYLIGGFITFFVALGKIASVSKESPSAKFMAAVFSAFMWPGIWLMRIGSRLK